MWGMGIKINEGNYLSVKDMIWIESSRGFQKY
jgi:hypothetical protein